MAFPWTGRVNRQGAALRATPSKNSSRPHEGIVADLALDTRVNVLAQRDGWLHVVIMGRQLEGYVSRELVSPVAPTAGEQYLLVPTGNMLTVVRGPARQAHFGYPALSELQFQALLQRLSIPNVTSATLSGYMSSLGFLGGFESNAPPVFSRELGRPGIQQSQWRGGLGEVSARHRGVMPSVDLNAIQNNHPIFDLRDWSGGLNSVKTSVRTPGAGGLYDTYLHGLRDILGYRQATYARAGASLYPNLAPADAAAQLLMKGYLSVNADHVRPFQETLRNPASYAQQAYRQSADLILSASPVRINSVTYTSYAQLEALQRNARAPAAARRQAEAALATVREQLASRVQSNGLTSDQLRNLVAFRRQTGIDNPQMTSNQLRGWIFPELITAASYGGGLRGSLRAAGGSSLRGGVGGGVVAVLCEGGYLLYEQPPDMGQRLVRTGVVGIGAGLFGGAAESLTMTQVGAPLARRMISQGSSTWLASGVGRGLGGGVAGGMAAPIFTLGALALDGQEHSGADYASAGTRAFVSGTLSAALAAGVVGGIWGTSVPIAGNVVGFLVGFGGYLLVDALVGDEVEQGVRSSMQR